ncbi:efflux RND transporter periplasmic adaptor subunit [Maricaulis sp. CAU 1757]
MKISFRFVFWSLAVLTVLALLVLALRPQAVPVDAGQVSAGPMTVAVRDEAYTRVRDVYVLAAPVGGRLLRVDAEPGDTVSAGDVLARLLPSEPAFLDARTEGEARAALHLAEAALLAGEAEIASSDAALELAQTEYDRMRSLHQRGIASQALLDQARTARRAALAATRRTRAAVQMREAELEAAQIRLMEPDENGGRVRPVIDLRAPIDGVVLRVLQESETPVAAGTVVIEVGDPADLEVVVELLSTDAVQVEPGDAVRLTGWSRDTRALGGQVRRVEPYGFTKVSALGVEEQRVRVIVDFSDPPEHWSALRHGYRVEAAITVWSEDETRQVPVSALFRHRGEWAVFTIEGGRARLTPVTIGRDNGEVAQLTSGPEADTPVVLFPGTEMTDGRRITLRQTR